MSPSRLGATRVRRILATGFVAFVLVQVAAGFVIDWVHPEIRFPEFHDQLAKLRAEPRTPDLVCLGSSRFLSAIDSGELTNELRRLTGRDDFRAFNAAAPGADPIVVERLFIQMQRCGIRPAAVVIEAAPHDLLRGNRWYGMHAARQLECSDMPEHGLELIRAGDLGRFAVARIAPLYVHRYAVLKNLCRFDLAPAARPVEPPISISDAEMARLLNTPATKEQIAAASLGVSAMARAYRDYEVGGASVRALERTLEQCNRQGTRVLLVGSPLSSTHRELLTPEIDAKYRGCLAELCGRFGASFVDCRNVLPDSLMADQHHARFPVGKIVFSRYLAREVLAAWLADRTPADSVREPCRRS